MCSCVKVLTTLSSLGGCDDRGTWMGGGCFCESSSAVKGPPRAARYTHQPELMLLQVHRRRLCNTAGLTSSRVEMNGVEVYAC